MIFTINNKKKINKLTNNKKNIFLKLNVFFCENKNKIQKKYYAFLGFTYYNLYN